MLGRSLYNGCCMLTGRQPETDAYLPEALRDEAVSSRGVGLLDAPVHALIWHLPEQADADQRTRAAMHRVGPRRHPADAIQLLRDLTPMGLFIKLPRGGAWAGSGGLLRSQAAVGYDLGVILTERASVARSSGTRACHTYDAKTAPRSWRCVGCNIPWHAAGCGLLVEGPHCISLAQVLRLAWAAAGQRPWQPGCVSAVVAGHALRRRLVGMR